MNPSKMQQCKNNPEHGVCIHRLEKGRTEKKGLGSNKIGYVWPDYYRCVKCSSEGNAKKYEKSIYFHCILKEERGGCCERCGYDEHPEILQWHHLRDKVFAISRKKITEKNIYKIREEIEKCLLLCPNCHAKEHNSVIYEEVLKKHNGIFK